MIIKQELHPLKLFLSLKAGLRVGQSLSKVSGMDYQHNIWSGAIQQQFIEEPYMSMRTKIRKMYVSKQFIFLFFFKKRRNHTSKEQNKTQNEKNN